jgi:putative ABC transport system permease protein
VKEFVRRVPIAARPLVRRPAFTVLVVATLALGTGANTAIFSVVNAVLLRPLPYPDADRLVMIWGTDVTQGDNETRVSYPDFRDWRESTTSFEDLGAFWTLPNTDVNLTGGVEPERVPVARVTAGYFEILGVRFAYGRGFRPEENVAGNHRVAILSHGLWQRRFGSDPSLVGRSVHVNGFPYTVVGILPADFRPLASLALGEDIELWRPLAPDDNQTGGRESRNLRVVGRLTPGVSVDRAERELAALARSLEEIHPETNTGHGVRLVPLYEQVVRGVRPALLALFAAVGLVLLSACTNVANLVLVRASGRRTELAVRRALGARPHDIITRLVGESLVLAVVGGLAGILIAYGGIRLLVALGPNQIPRLDEIGLDVRVLSFALAVSLVSGLLVGLAPALQAAGADPADGLRQGAQRGGAVPGSRLRRTLVLSQLIATFVLLVGATLLIRSFATLLDVDPGFQPERLFTFQLELPMGTKYPEQWQRQSFFDELLDRIARHPDVLSVTMASAPPLGEGDFRTTFSVAGQAEDGASHSPANIQLIGPDYFGTLGIPFVAGRAFTERDNRDAPRVAIINQTAARRWPERRAIGSRIVPTMRFLPEAEIVGIARDARVGGLDDEVPPIVYLPSEQVGYNFMTVMVRTASAPSALFPAIRETVRDLDAEQPIYNVRTMDELISRSVAERRFQMLLLTTFSGIALLLALGGVYGVMSYTVVQRTREIGVRMALGARPRDVSREIVRESAALGLIAIAIGVPLALLFTRLLAASLFGIGPADPWSYAATVAMTLATVVLSAGIPALRAASVAPLTALRAE